MGEEQQPPSISKTLGMGESIEFEGSLYHFTPFGFARRGEFEKWARRKAREEVSKMLEEAQSGDCKMQDYLEFKEATTALISSGYYDSGQKGFDTRLRTVDGQTWMYYLMLQPKHPGITLDVVARMMQAKFEELAMAATETNRGPVLPNAQQAVTKEASPS